MNEVILVDDRQLAMAELQRLVECEDVIKRGLETFVEVGIALAEIRDKRLYRAQFERFDDYCRTKWGFAARTAHQTIASANVVRLIGDCEVLPARESIARQLVGLPADEAKRVWLEAIANSSKVTAEQLRRLIRRSEHASQPLPKVVQTMCPACRHQFVPYKPETASRGSRVSSPGVEWACKLLPDDVRSAIDYGCGRFRNAPLLEQRFAHVTYADTAVQCERLHSIAGDKRLTPVDGLTAHDALFIICVLHVLRGERDRRAMARHIIELAPRYLVVETPRNQTYYKGKLRRGHYRTREGTYYWELTNGQIDRLFAARYKLQHRRTVKHNECRVFVLK